MIFFFCLFVSLEAIPQPLCLMTYFGKSIFAPHSKQYLYNLNVSSLVGQQNIEVPHTEHVYITDIGVSPFIHLPWFLLPPISSPCLTADQIGISDSWPQILQFTVAFSSFTQVQTAPILPHCGHFIFIILIGIALRIYFLSREAGVTRLHCTRSPS